MQINESMRVKIGLIGAPLDTGNLGVSALAESSIKVILNRWPDAEIILLGSGYMPRQHYLFTMGKNICIRTFPIRFSKNIFLPYHFLRLTICGLLAKMLPESRFRDALANSNPYFRTLLEMNLVADISGGDSFSDIYGMHRYVTGFLCKWLVIFLGKKLVLLPQTYGPFKRPIAKMMARYVVNHASLIYSRDWAGVEYVNELLNNDIGKGKVRFTPDVAFVLDVKKPSNMDIGSLTEVHTDKSIVIGLNVSGLLYYGGYTQNNMFGLKKNYRRVIHHIIDFLMAKEDVLLLLVPHVFVSSGTVENDAAACFNIFEESSVKYPERIFMVRGSYDPSQIKYIIGLCDFFLGSRMHSCIAALSQMIPVVGLAYSKKFSGVFDSIGVGDLVIDLRSETEDAILAFVEKGFSERKAIAAKLSQTIPEAQKAILKTFSPILS